MQLLKYAPGTFGLIAAFLGGVIALIPTERWVIRIILLTACLGLGALSLWANIKFENQKSTKAKREQLSVFLEEGNALLRIMERGEEYPARFVDWNNQVIEYLETLGPEYPRRFRSETNISLGSPSQLRQTSTGVIGEAPECGSPTYRSLSTRCAEL